MNIGIVGIGFMGWIHWLAYPKVRGAKVTAICTRDPKKLAGDWRDIQGNFGPPGAQVDLSKLDRYSDWHELIADPKVDLVDICLPPDMHAPVALAAFKAGKHVLCEKPICTSLPEGRRMVKAARDAGKLLMIGQVLPFFPEYAWALDAMRGGKYGKLLGGHFKRIIADPTWLKDFFNLKKVGGPVIDLHIHDAHFIRLACGMPAEVSSSGWKRGAAVEFINTQFRYGADGPMITASGGVVKQQGRAFTHSFEIYLERATLLYEFATLDGQPTAIMPLTVLGEKGKVMRPKLREVDAFSNELGEVARAVKSGKPSDLLAGDLALDALLLCEKQIQSVDRGKPVRV